jgi:hypothetical protein
MIGLPGTVMLQHLEDSRFDKASPMPFFYVVGYNIKHIYTL